MNKILLSVMTIALVVAAGVYSTQAYFNDTETSKDNVIKAGTIDISVNNQNPWAETLLTSNMDDLKPGMQKTVTFTVKNEGVNALVLWKRVNVTAREQGLQSEPETEAETALGGPKVDLDSKINYDMTVGTVNTIPAAWNVMMSDIDQLWIPLGKVEAGASLPVTQVYKLDEQTGNEYQGDQLTFDIDLYAEQLNGPGPSHTSRGLVLENKAVNPDNGYYQFPIMDQTWGLLTWDGSGVYKLRAWGLNNGNTYRVAYWNGSSESGVSTLQAPAGGSLVQTGTYASFNTNVDAKYWLRPNDWDNAKTLWESNLVN